MTLIEINHRLLKTLFDIDQEATPVEDDYPTGLWWYTGHLDRDCESRRKQNSEFEWTRQMAKMLPANKQGLRASEQCFPNSTQRCDLVFDVKKSKPFWAEVKGAWRARLFDPPPALNSSFHKHLVSAAGDVDKLLKLTPEDACGIALVLVGFDREANPITEADLVTILAKTNGMEWVESTAMWHVNKKFQFRTRLWVWSKWT